MQADDLVAGGGAGGPRGVGAPQRDEGVEPLHAALPQVQEQDRELLVGEPLRFSLKAKSRIMKRNVCHSCWISCSCNADLGCLEFINNGLG
jgi:hypothetical protein